MDQQRHEATDAGDLRDKKMFTTGEAAALCKVSQQTIIRCFDAGRLQGFRVPGSKFRRIPREELIRFMKANAIPLEALEGSKKRILVVDDRGDFDLFLREGSEVGAHRNGAHDDVVHVLSSPRCGR